MKTSEQVRNLTYFEKYQSITKRRELVYQTIKFLGIATLSEVSAFLGAQKHMISGRFSELVNRFMIKEAGTVCNGDRTETQYRIFEDSLDKNLLIVQEILDLENLMDQITEDLDKINMLQLSQHLKGILTITYKKSKKRLQLLKKMMP